jgi:hypothetical protein
MKLKLVSTLLLVFLIHIIQAAPPDNFIVGMFDDQEKPVAIAYSAHNKKSFVLTKKRVYQLSHDKMELVYESNLELYCILATDTSIWMGTDNGIIIILLRSKKQSFIKTDSKIANYKVVTIFKNADQHIYIGTDAFGLYQYNVDTVPEKISTIFPINKGVSTADTTMWVGTDVGLFRYRKDGWIRYNEEGVSNFEIPDNIVENLVVDNTGLLWILMRNGLAVIETPQEARKNHKHDSEDGHDHIPSTEYLGCAQNTIYDVHHYRNKGYFFATDMGLLYLPSHKDEDLLENFHHSHEEKVENKALLKILNTQAINERFGKIIFISAHGSVNYLICERGVYKLTKSTLKKILS